MDRPVLSPKVAIIILNWNGYEDTVQCLESLKQVVYPSYNILVIDNGSKKDETILIRQRFGDFVQLIRSKTNLGFAGGNNLGIRWAISNHADYVLLLNNDVVVDSNFLDGLVKAAESSEDIGVVGPKVYYYYRPDLLQSAGGKISYWTGDAPLLENRTIDTLKYMSPKEVDFVSGCSLLVKSKILPEIGLLNEKYFAFYEETEWCSNARQAGYKVVYVPFSKVWHKSGASTPSKMAFYLMTRNRFLFVKRNSGSVRYTFFIVYFFITDPIKNMVTLKIMFKPELLKTYVKAIFDGLRIF